ncbi:MAG: inositol-3-phosphate synthase [Planctomycetes bacterium]|nr:inositol-3-phosphate synthase [Planctomycetota bacterium]
MSKHHRPSSGEAAQRRVGVWLVGARGSVATCVVYGLAGLRQGLLEPTGLATETEPFSSLDLAPLESLHFGGHDVCTRPLTQSAGELVRHNILPPDLVTATSADAARYEAHIRPGVLDAADVGLADLHPEAAGRGALAPREQIAVLTRDLDEFQREEALDRVVVVHMASTEAYREPRAAWRSLDAFELALDAGEAQPASVVYAYAALASGRPFVNFTPSLGSTLPALRELARSKRVPHCGSDGKTGETLVKTVLAPLFVARRLKVLAWQGYNMLGNRDGETLADPLHKESKLRSKDDALRSLLGDPEAHTKVGIDFVPSLRDWKTAFDYIHFEGFLGARMSLQFTWQGSDSALAAPLVLDLVRWAEFAARHGEFGEMPHTAPYFKSPLCGGTHDFHAQFERLLAYAAEHSR